MSKKRKVNPRRIPVSKADIDKAKSETVNEAVETAMALMFTVLRDKEGYDLEGLRRVYGHINDLSDSVANGYVTIPDLKYVLKTEAGVNIK